MFLTSRNFTPSLGPFCSSFAVWRDETEVSEDSIHDRTDNEDQDRGCEEPEHNACGQGDKELGLEAALG